MAVKRMKKRLKISMDRIGELPDDILYFILSLLTVKEAVRTSILSRRWRSVWKTSLAVSPNLNLDVAARRDNGCPHNEFGDCLAGELYNCVFPPSRRLGFKRHDFVGFVLHVLHLDHFSVKDSSRTRFYLKKDFLHFTDQWMEMAISQMKDFSHHIDQWIKMAIDKRNQNPKIGSSHFVIHREIYRDGNLYVQFPRLFSTQEIGSSLKCWSLKGCSFRSLYSKGYSSFVDLRLKKVPIVSDTVVSILSICPNLENLCLSNCKSLRRLKISGPSLKLKQLAIHFCFNLKKIKINAKNLTRFQYSGNWVKFTPINVPQLSNVIIRTVTEDSCHALSYARGKLSSDVPHLESLMLSLSPIEEKKIPRQFSLFANLKKLVLLVRMHGGTLWGFVPLLQASPYLRRLELHMYNGCGEVNKEGLMERPLDFPHLHLEKIILSGFSGCSHDIEFATFMLNSATNLKRLAIFSSIICYTVESATLCTYSQKQFKDLAAKANEDKKTEKDVWEQLGIPLRPGVELLVAA